MTKRHIPILLLLAAVITAVVVSPSRAQNVKRDNTPIVPVIPRQDHSNPDRVFLEHADRLLSKPGVDYQILSGNVQFRRGGMYMYCDSAHFSDVTGNFDAFGNVRMEQGDTLFIYADQLAYEDERKLAVLYADEGKDVRLINKDVTLETPVFNYDMGIDLGYYENVGGKLFDSLNTLTSIDGEYNPTTKEAIFTSNVHLQSSNSNNGDTLEIYTQNLYYNTLTHIALMDDESTVRNADGIIYTSNGEYNTESTITQLFNRSTVVSMMENSRGTTLTADTIYYDRKLGRGEAFGNMILTDTINKMILEGNYGYFDSMIDSAFVTGHARVISYQPVGDGDFNPDMVDTLYVNDTFTRSQGTIYLHGDTIRAFRIIKEYTDTIWPTLPDPNPASLTDSVSPIVTPISATDSIPLTDTTISVNDSVSTDLPSGSLSSLDSLDSLDSLSTLDSPSVLPEIRHLSDTIRYVVANPHVKFYRKDMQGLCDSLTYVSADTMVYMHYSPIVWSDNRQISGDVINIHLKDSVAGDNDSKHNMTLDKAVIPTGGFMAELIEEGYYNQLSGKEMIAQFCDGALSHLDVNGNVLAITFPEENDSTINKVLNVESSFLAADFANNTIKHMKLWSETNATVTPLYLAKKSLFYLPAFKWYGEYRPANPDDIFDFPESLQELFNAARAKSSTSAARPAAQPQSLQSVQSQPDLQSPQSQPELQSLQSQPELQSPQSQPELPSELQSDQSSPTSL